jgi:hypothetical protein
MPAGARIGRGGGFAALVSVADVNAVMATSPRINAGSMAQAVKTRDYWKSIAPVSTREHALKSGYVDHPGQYRDSIRIQLVYIRGMKRWRVFTDDFKRFWIEYGTKKWAKHACRERTLQYMRNEGGGLGGSAAA